MARAIDASELMAEIQVCSWGSEQDREQAEDLVLGMPTLTPPNEWVSVEERLPNDKQIVLFRQKNGFIYCAEYFAGNSLCPFPHRLTAARRRERRTPDVKLQTMSCGLRF